MPWQSRSSRAAGKLPANWPTIRTAVLQRDSYRCRLAGPECTRTATQVDHMGDGNDHRLHQLRAVCSRCHMQRTARQAHAARPPRNRPPEPHPGLRKP